MKIFKLLILLNLIFVGCATDLNPEAQLVEMKSIGPSDEGRKCNFIIQIKESKWMGSREAVENQLRNAAAKLGGNYVHILRIYSPGESTFGEANVYRCDDSKK